MCQAVASMTFGASPTLLDDLSSSTLGVQSQKVHAGKPVYAEGHGPHSDEAFQVTLLRDTRRQKQAHMSGTGLVSERLEDHITKGSQGLERQQMHESPTAHMCLRCVEGLHRPDTATLQVNAGTRSISNLAYEEPHEQPSMLPH